MMRPIHTGTRTPVTFVLVTFCIASLIGGVFVIHRRSAAQETAHPHRLKHPDGSWMYTNALVNQTSPYLLQHAHNPVDWYPWGPEAFEAARRSGKPIFLSIGYSTCYWCHVMERQVFENPQLAALMNKHCINIKVDREERPDIDQIYMTAVQLMTGHGGWPMSVFLTPPGAAQDNDPGLTPFWAGTYIPPQPQYGMPGFAQLIDAIADAWSNRRQALIQQGRQVADAVSEHLRQKDPPTPLDFEIVDRAADQLVRMYDPMHGGFGQAPKFPQPTNLQFLFAFYRHRPSKELSTSLRYTLERMARGGMYDQIGGGFHRYATDQQWLVPHFEKMLYDNGQLVEAYLNAHSLEEPGPNEKRLYRRVIQETCDYVLREMTDASGAFWSAQDAEVDAREGGNYLWTPRQVREAIDHSRLGQLAVKLYGLDKGTNFQDPHHQDLPPTNVLYLPLRLDTLADQQDMTLQALYDARIQINERMLAARNRRKQPGTDDKVLVSWNGMMIAALAAAGAELDQPRYTTAAAKAADYILKHMRESAPAPPGDGPAGRGLYRTMRHEQVKISGFLDDYAFLVHGLVQLYRATKQSNWLDAAQELTGVARQRFSATDRFGGGYYDTLADQSDLFVRIVSTYDGAIPSGNSQMVHNLIDLYQLTGRKVYIDQACLDLKAFSGTLTKRGAAMVHMHHALLRALGVAPGQFAATAQPIAGPAPATQPDRTVVSVAVAPDSVDLSSGPAQLQVTVEIGPGYHLNAPDCKIEGLVPTTLELTETEGYQMHVEYPPGTPKRYPLAPEVLHVYEGRVVLVATIRATAQVPTTPVPQRPSLVLRYQACTDRSCLEPVDIDIPVPLAGVR